MLYGAYIYRYDIGDGKIFYCHSIQILSAEYPYSTGRISIFCWQNIHILPAESQYSARRIWIFCRQNRNNQEQLHWAQKACTPWAELGTAQPPSCFFVCFFKHSLSHLRSARLLRYYSISAGKISRFCQNMILPAYCDYFAGKISRCCQ